MSRTRWIAAIGITTLATAVAAWGQTAYTAIVLHPAGYDHSQGTGLVAGQQVGFSYGAVGHPLLWGRSAGSVVDLNPPGYLAGQAWATDGTHQVGYTVLTSGSGHHATVWSGTAASAVDLHPAAFSESEASGVAANQAVGAGAGPNGLAHAILWDLTTGTVTDLNPSGFETSSARATDGVHQIGTGTLAGMTDVVSHALLWSGSADSAIDLTPDPNTTSAAFGIAGDQIVGEIAGGGAALWVGPSHTFVNLGGQDAYATNGTYQVGVAYGGHAVRWSGTAESIFDLQQFLPAEYVGSAAYGIDAAGNIIGEAAGPNGWEAVMWVPVVPEPGIIAAALAGMALPLLRSSGRGRRVTDAEPTSR